MRGDDFGGQVLADALEFQSTPLHEGRPSATIQNVHPGWRMDFQITSGSATSAVATVDVAGVSTAPYTGNPSIVPPVATVVSTSTETIHRAAMSDGTVKIVSDVTTQP